MISWQISIASEKKPVTRERTFVKEDSWIMTLGLIVPQYRSPTPADQRTWLYTWTFSQSPNTYWLPCVALRDWIWFIIARLKPALRASLKISPQVSSMS